MHSVVVELRPSCVCHSSRQFKLSFKRLRTILPSEKKSGGKVRHFCSSPPNQQRDIEKILLSDKKKKKDYLYSKKSFLVAAPLPSSPYRGLDTSATAACGCKRVDQEGLQPDQEQQGVEGEGSERCPVVRCRCRCETKPWPPPRSPPRGRTGSW